MDQDIDFRGGGTADATGTGHGHADVPAEFADYQKLDLGPNSEAVAWLDVRMDTETGTDGATVQLTDGLDREPAGLTPNMSTWYSRFIANKRLAALEAIRSRFEADRVNGVPSVVREFEIDRIDNHARSSKHQRLDEFDTRYRALKDQADAAEHLFRLRRADLGNREPRMVHPALYLIGLMVIVALELALNFESFMAVRWIGSPFLATGCTLLVALAIGWASHLHGSLLRQWDYYFGPHDRTRFHQGVRMAAIGECLFLIAIFGVLAARYYYIVPLIENAILIAAEPPSLAGSLMFMIAGNLIIYLVGIAWAFMTHDETPDYPALKRAAVKTRAKLDRRFQKEVVDELNRLQRKAEAEKEMIRQRARGQEGSANSLANSQLFAMLRAKDEEVCSVLRDYRARLTQRHPGVHYLYPDREVTSRERRVTLAAGEWAARDLPLKYQIA